MWKWMYWRSDARYSLVFSLFAMWFANKAWVNLAPTDVEQQKLVVVQVNEALSWELLVQHCWDFI